MKTFDQFLAEGRDAPLYHATNIGAAAQIIDNDMIKAGYSKSPIPGQKDQQYAVSFTRSLRFARDWYGAEIILEFDQAKLVQNNRLIPSNFFSQVPGALEQSRVARPKTMITFTGGKIETEFEELVVGSVHRVSKCLTKLIINRPGVLTRIRDDPSRHYEILLNHPLLYTFEKQKIVPINS